METPPRRTARPYASIRNKDPYCDSIGCHIPHSIGHVKLKLMGLFWAGNSRHLFSPPRTTCEAVLDLDADHAAPMGAIQGQQKNRSYLSDRIISHIHAPGFAQVSLSPVRRLVYGSNLVIGNEHDRANLHSVVDIGKPGEVRNSNGRHAVDTLLRPVAELFRMDHSVFSQYGSWFTIMLFENILKIGDACFQALLQLTDLMETWAQDRAQESMETLAQKMKLYCRGGGFETRDVSACVSPALDTRAGSGSRNHVSQLRNQAAAWEQFLFGQHQVISCSFGDYSNSRLGTVTQIKHGIQLRSPDINIGFNVHERLSLAQKAHFYNKYPRVRFSLCPIETQGGMLRNVSDGRFELSMIGVTLYEGGKLEAALFLGSGNKNSDSCVLVDGQRTFSSIPVSYLSRWTCEYESVSRHDSSQRVVVSETATVVSYSSAVAILSCDLPPESTDDTSTHQPIFRLVAKHLKWRLDLPLCEAVQFTVNEGIDDSWNSAGWESVAGKPPWNPPSTCCSYDDYFGSNPHEKINAKRRKPSLSRREDLLASVKQLHEDSVDKRAAPDLYFRQRTMTLCSQVLYKLDSLHSQRLVREWIYYHHLIGIRHFVFYDRDGSLKNALRPFLELTRSSHGWESYVVVKYYPMFSLSHLGFKHHMIHAKLGAPSHAAPDAIAAAHCLWQQRGRSEWVALLHAPDEYLSNSHGLRHIEEILTPLRELQIDILDVSQIYFVNFTRNSDVLIGRYAKRANEPILMPLGWGSRLFKNSFLNRFGSPVVRPEAVSELVAAHYPRANNLFFSARVLDEVGQDFARANHYGHAFSIRDPLATDNYLVYDNSIQWAEKIMTTVDD